VVGADGLSSGVAAAAGLREVGCGGRKFGFASDVTGPGAGVIRPDTIEMFVVPGGYLGVVRHGREGVHVAGLVSLGATATRSPSAFIESVAGRFALLREAGLQRLEQRGYGRWLGAGPIPCRPRAVAGDRVALVGDAAGYIEPFTGEGMSWALEGAEVLSEVLADRMPGEWTPATALAYRRAWRARVGRRQRLCRALALALGRSGLQAGLFYAASGHPILSRWLVRRVVTP
jgi:flavin-dependent dehydrogenase